MLVGLDDWWLGALSQAAQRRWGHVEELLALVAELLHAQYRAFIQANSKEGTPLPAPLRIPRPDAAEATVRSSSPSEIAAFFGRR